MYFRSALRIILVIYPQVVGSLILKINKYSITNLYNGNPDLSWLYSNNRIEQDALDHSKLVVLDPVRSAVLELSYDKVVSDWKQKNGDNVPMTIDDVLRIVSRNDSHIILSRDIEEKGNEIDDEIVFITEEELKFLWRRNSKMPMGKSMESFVLEDALLLVEEDEIPVDVIETNYDDDLEIFVSLPVMQQSHCIFSGSNFCTSA